jgi:sulfofructose kinase
MNLDFILPSETTFDVVGLGLNAVDYLCVVPHFPRFDSKLKMLDFRIQGGGQAATAMVACGRLGLKTRYIGKVGNDAIGQFSLKSLEQEGVDTEGVTIVTGARNQLAVILIDQETGERTIIWDRDARLYMKPEEVPKEILCSAKVLLLDGHDAGAAVQAARYAKDAGMVVVMDAEKISDDTEELVSLVDILIGERHFPENFTGCTDSKKALQAIAERGPKLAGVTLGTEGALIIYQGTFYHSPAFEISCQDSTGAGDVFHAAFIRTLFENWDVEQCLDFSNAVAALKCQGLGGRSNLPSFSEALDFMKEGCRRAKNPSSALSLQPDKAAE